MIAHLRGKLIYKSPTASVIECQGVGYEIFHTPHTAENLKGEIVSVHVHTHLREDVLQLFGFFDLEEKGLFRELLKVTSVGPKLALAILSGIHHRDLTLAIQNRDLTRLQGIPGIGKKTAERLSVELSDRLKKMAPMIGEVGLDSKSELESILLNLGYQKNEIQKAVSGMQDKDLPLESLVKQALGELTKVKTVRMN